MSDKNKIRGRILHIRKNYPKDKDIYDNIEYKIFKFLKFIGLLALLFCWGGIPILLLNILHISPEHMSTTMKVLISFCFDALLLIIYFFIYSKIIVRDFRGYFNKDFGNHFKLSFSRWLMGFGIMIVSNLLIAIITNGVISQNEESVREMIDLSPMYMAFQLMIYAPFTEELIFRKSIKDFCSHKTSYVLISGLIFGGLHVLSSLDYSFGFLYLIPYCSLGCIFASLYYETDNIFSTIVAHFIHNSLALLIYMRGL